MIKHMKNSTNETILVPNLIRQTKIIGNINALKNSESNLVEPAENPSKIKYKIRVETSESYHAGTDDKVFIIMYGPKGSTGKFRLNNSGDDFEGGWNDFHKNAKDNVVGDIGLPYAIALILEGGDGWIIDGAEVHYSYPGKSTEVAKFVSRVELGDKGDFGLPEARKGVTLFAGDCVKDTLKDTIEIGRSFIFIDNLENDKDVSNSKRITQQVSVREFLGETTNIENKITVKLSGSIGGGWFGSGHKYEIEEQFTYAREVKNEQETTMAVEVDEEVNLKAEKNTLSVLERIYTLNVSYTNIEIGNTNVNLQVFDIPKAGYRNVNVNETYKTFNSMEELRQDQYYFNAWQKTR
jgi:hypothetical protein